MIIHFFSGKRGKLVDFVAFAATFFYFGFFFGALSRDYSVNVLFYCTAGNCLSAYYFWHK